MEYTQTEYRILSLFAMLFGLLSFLVGGFDPPVYALLTLIVIDFGTGLWAGWVNAVVSSKRGYNGMKRKGFILAMVILANLLDCGIGTGHVCRAIVVGPYVVLEVVSIIENFDRIGYGDQIPPFLREKLIQIRKEKGI